MRERVMRRGFTLIELTFVLTIMALFAGIVVVSFRGPFQSARFDDGISRIIALDESARGLARRFDRPLEIEFEFSTSVVTVIEHGEKNNKTDHVFAPLRLSNGVQFEAVQLGAHKRVASGTATIFLDGDGKSTSYGVRVSGPGNRRSWLVFIGSTGQVIQHENQRKTPAILRLATQRRDAD